MKKLLAVLTLCMVGLLNGCGVVDTAAERHRRIVHKTDIELRMFVDDWDYFWLMDRNSNLSRWHPRVGI